jgi:hypothetical protein
MVLDMFIEVAHSHDVMATALVLFDERKEVPPKIVSRIQVGSFLLYECRLLLMEGCGAGTVSGLLADLVGRNKDCIATLGADCGHIRPLSIYIAVRVFDASCCVTLNDDCSASGFVIRDGLVFTAAEFETNRMMDLSSGLVECLTYMVLLHVTFVFYDALKIDFILFLIFA